MHGIGVLREGQSAAAALRDLCLADGQEDAFYFCDVDEILDRFRVWERHFPGVVPYYAVKCNDTEVVLRTVAAHGAGFDCATKSEMERVVALGVDPGRIIYAHTAKPPSHLSHAAAVGINLTVFDGEDELHKIKKLHPESKLLLRVRCDAAQALSRLGEKFGCSAETDSEPLRLLRAARALGLHVQGVCFHVGSGCEGAEVFREAVRLSSRVCAIGKQLGYDMNLLNIGGGFPGHDDKEFAKMAKVLNDAISEFFLSPSDLTIIGEPGRFFVCSAFSIAANVTSRRVLHGPDGDIAKVLYYVNAGIHSGFKFFSKSFEHGKPLLEPVENASSLTSYVFGPTCDGADKLEGPVQMPLLDLGSWLIYPYRGAYTLTLSSGFNGFLPLKVHAVTSKATSTWLLLADRSPFTETFFYHL